MKLIKDLRIAQLVIALLNKKSYHPNPKPKIKNKISKLFRSNKFAKFVKFSKFKVKKNNSQTKSKTHSKKSNNPKMNSLALKIIILKPRNKKSAYLKKKSNVNKI